MPLVPGRPRAYAVLLASALSLVVAACAQHEYEVVVAFDPPELANAVVRVEVALVADCAAHDPLGVAPVDARVIATVDRGGSHRVDIGDVEPGTYGVYARAYDEGCMVRAAVCVPVTLEANGSGQIPVTLTGSAFTGAACADGLTCESGACVPCANVQVVAVVAGYQDETRGIGGFTCALARDGSVWCWGDGNLGVLGIGVSGPGNDRVYPARVGAETTWSALTAGEAHVCGLQSDGTLWCWGENARAELGIGTMMLENEPRRVGMASDWAEVRARGQHTCARKMDGSWWCWGDNEFGQLGLGDTTRRATPEVLPGGPWASVALGRKHTCGIGVDASLWCWGLNELGQLGLGTYSATDFRSIPERVGTDADWLDATGGESHTCGRRAGGTAYCWGRNNAGQLGHGDTASVYASPQRVVSDRSWLELSAGEDHTCGRIDDTTLWCWGDNALGQVGTGGAVEESSPAQIGSAAGWAGIGLGEKHSCAVRDDGALHCWGQNNHGQLGVGDTADRATPARVCFR